MPQNNVSIESFIIFVIYLFYLENSLTKKLEVYHVDRKINSMF